MVEIYGKNHFQSHPLYHTIKSKNLQVFCEFFDKLFSILLYIGIRVWGLGTRNYLEDSDLVFVITLCPDPWSLVSDFAIIYRIRVSQW